MNKPVPTSPNEMPHDWHNDANAIRNALVSLHSHSYVDIHWERDHRSSEAADESIGQWDISIEVGKKIINVSHPEITNALWFAIEISDASRSQAYQEAQTKRAAALAKLTPEERRLLDLA